VHVGRRLVRVLYYTKTQTRTPTLPFTVLCITVIQIYSTVTVDGQYRKTTGPVKLNIAVLGARFCR
jgi:hypothetical protein